LRLKITKIHALSEGVRNKILKVVVLHAACFAAFCPFVPDGRGYGAHLTEGKR
jgi:hypothetical protein